MIKIGSVIMNTNKGSCCSICKMYQISFLSHFPCDWSWCISNLRQDDIDLCSSIYIYK